MFYGGSSCLTRLSIRAEPPPVTWDGPRKARLVNLKGLDVSDKRRGIERKVADVQVMHLSCKADAVQSSLEVFRQSDPLLQDSGLP